MRLKLLQKIAVSLPLLACLALAGCASASGADLKINADSHMELAQAALDGKLDELYDYYFGYFTPQEYNTMLENLSGSFGGVGISMTNSEDGNVQVYGIIQGTPAANSSIAEGDIIIGVDGTSLIGKTSSDAQLLIRGEVGTQVKLNLRRSDGTEYQVTLTRATINNESVTGCNFPAYPGTAYIRISSFTDQTANEFTAIYNQLYSERAITNLILDLRSNGGGSFLSSILLGEYFVPVNEVIVSEKTSEGEQAYRSSNGQLSKLNVAILQNAYTASASEVLIGAIKDKGHATLIGNTSFGKGITQNMAQMASGSGHRYTRSIYYTPSGFSLNGVGLEPDIVVEDPQDATYATYFSLDPAKNTHLQAALDFFFPEGVPTEGSADEADTEAEEGDTAAEGEDTEGQADQTTPNYGGFSDAEE